jgi:hypothetical protein
LAATGGHPDFVVTQFERRLESISLSGSANRDRLRRVELRPSTIKLLAVGIHGRGPAISGPSALPPNFLQSGHASSSINGQPYSGAKGEPLREVAQI